MSDALHVDSQPVHPDSSRFKLALVWRGDPDTPEQPTRHLVRLQPLVHALTEAEIEIEPVAYFDEAAAAVQECLLRCDGVMVWVNPLSNGGDRSRLDIMLREVADGGVWVSAHPDVIRKMGTKEVLYRTRPLGWDADTHLYETFQAFQERFPARLEAGQPRILKPQRGNDGQGVWKVQWQEAGGTGHSSAVAMLVVQAAADDRVEIVPLPDFLERCMPHFSGGNCLIDQAFQRRVADGMIRCYLSQDRIVGFAEQWPRRETAAAGLPALGMDSAKTMHEPSGARFRDLRRLMEDMWLPAMLGILELSPDALPAIWDADFLLGPSDAAGADTYVLCEINISSVLPFPDTAVGSIALTAANRMEAARQARRGTTPTV